MALTVITEMAATAEQDRKLSAILTTVERTDARLRLESDARLRTAEQAIRQAHSALLDRAAIPESVGWARHEPCPRQPEHVHLVVWMRLPDEACQLGIRR